MFGQSTAGASPVEPVRLGWQRPDGMALLGLVNVLLRLVTFNIYQFWGKAEVRRRLWSAVRINDEPLTYTGTGWELFRGFLLSLFLFLLPFVVAVTVIQIALAKQPALMSLALLAVYVPFFLLVFVAFYTASRYRLSRTEWRGIRGGLVGSAWGYAWACLWTGFLAYITLGWLWPWRSTYLQRRLVTNMRFGNRPFSFDATSGPLYGRFAVLWFIGAALTVALAWAINRVFLDMMNAGVIPLPTPGVPEQKPTPEDVKRMMPYFVSMAGYYVGYIALLGIVGSWYAAKVYNHFANHTHFEGATFRGSVTGLGLIWQALSSILIVILSVGILTPVAMARLLGYRVRNTALEGQVPLSEVIQSGTARSTSGEGLAQLFDIDVF